jgi:hypothetical protein
MAATDHGQARRILAAHEERAALLEAARAYADAVLEATRGHGRTPVRPLATMGPGGGPLLCDHCRKPMILEGGRFHGRTADAAWAECQAEDWVSYILGGMVLEHQTNGTLRVYHGYPERPGHCYTLADRADKKAREEFRARPRDDIRPALYAYLAAECPDTSVADRAARVAAVWDLLYSYDPGLGVNGPDRAGV